MRISAPTRIASALSAVAVCTLLTAAPAIGENGEGSGASSPPTVDVGKLLNSIDTPAAPVAEPPETTVRTVYVDDGLEGVQIALGALAGSAFTAAAAAAIAARRHRGHLAHPA